jgi:hypothetical protein
MSNSIKTGHFTQDGGIINLPLGFVPEYIELMDFHTDTNIIFYKWWRRMESDQASGKQEGVSIAEGITANLADDAGIIAYNTGTQTPTIEEWTEARATAATARTATAAGTYLKATVSNGADRGSVFECRTAGTSSGTEPTWPVVDGEQVLDSDVLFEKVNVSLQRGGYQGIVIQDNIQTDGQEMYYVALKADQDVDHGDVDGWASGIDPDA